jgi:hypothetical protein
LVVSGHLCKHRHATFDAIPVKQPPFYQSRFGILIAIFGQEQSFKRGGSDVIRPATIVEAAIRWTRSFVNRGMQYYPYVGESGRPSGGRA